MFQTFQAHESGDQSDKKPEATLKQIYEEFSNAKIQPKAQKKIAIRGLQIDPKVSPRSMPTTQGETKDKDASLLDLSTTSLKKQQVSKEGEDKRSIDNRSKQS